MHYNSSKCGIIAKVKRGQTIFSEICTPKTDTDSYTINISGNLKKIMTNTQKNAIIMCDKKIGFTEIV